MLTSLQIFEEHSRMRHPCIYSQSAAQAAYGTGTQTFRTSRKMSGSESTSFATPRPATQDYVECYTKLSYDNKYYWRLSYGIKHSSPSFYRIKWYNRSIDFHFYTFSFCFVCWTNGSGPTTVPHSDCDGAPLRVEVHTPYVSHAVGGRKAHLPLWYSAYLAI